MKKFLSLVLALVMAMSLVTISAGAKDFADNGEITYKEAVDVISAMKVVDGYEDGSFNPTGNLTRGAAAKIICNLILGPTTAAALKADTAPYSDVSADHTFAGYIAYCQQQGIISGYADGTFKPANPLTGYAFMKMLLGALGYDATVEGYVGANWSVQVAKQAIAIGLDDGNDDFNGVETVNREEAALYAFNTLTATMVDYSSKVEVDNGNGSTVTISGGRYNCGNKLADDYRTSDDYEKNDPRDTAEQFCERYFGKLELRTANAADAFGRPANTWYNGKTKIGTYAIEADAVYTTNQKSKDIYADLGISDAIDFAVIVDGEPCGTFEVAKKDSTKLATTIADCNIGNGSLIEVFEDEKVITVVNSYLLQVGADYDEDDEELELVEIDDSAIKTPVGGWDSADALTLKLDDIAGIEDYKEDDYVIVTVAEGIIKSIAPAEMVTATVTEYVDDESVTADDTDYSYASTNNNTSKPYELKEEYELYLDAYGYVLYADGVDVETNYVWVDEFSVHTSSSKAAWTADVVFTDGTEDEVTISKIDGDKVSGQEALKNYATGWYTYEIKNDKYELEPIGDVVTADSKVGLGTGVITNYDDQGTKLGTNTNVRANSNTIFVIRDQDDDISVYTGIKNVPDITVDTDGLAASVVNNKYAKVVFIELGTDGEVSGGSDSSDLIYFLSFDKTGTDKDENDYVRVKAVVNGEETKVKIAADEYDTIWAADTLVTNVEYDENGYIIDCDPVVTDDDFEVASVDAANVTYKNGTINFVEGDVSYSFYLADDNAIYFIDLTADDVVKEVTTGKLTNDYKTATLAATIYAVLDANGDVAALYINA